MGKIRLLLALSVVISHGVALWHLHFVGGKIAVQSFFIISGFYMSMILNEKYVGVNGSYKLFITNRFLRLYPIYWVVLLLTLVFGICITNVFHPNYVPEFAIYATIKPSFLSLAYLVGSQLVIFGQELALFMGIDPGSGNLFFTKAFLNTHPQLWTYMLIPQAWSLSLELMFYLVAPLILRRGPKIVAAVILLSLLSRFITYDYFNLHGEPWTYRFFPNEIIFFLLGYVSYRIYLNIRQKTLPAYLNKATLFAALMFIFIYKPVPEMRIPYIPFSMKDVLYFSVFTLSIPVIFKFQKSNKIDQQTGELSYPFYIVHVLVLGFCSAIWATNAWWLVIPMILVVSYLLNVLVAVPIEKYRQLRLKRSKTQKTPNQLSVSEVVTR